MFNKIPITRSDLIHCGKPMVRTKARVGLYYWRCKVCGKYLPDKTKESPNYKYKNM